MRDEKERKVNWSLASMKICSKGSMSGSVLSSKVWVSWAVRSKARSSSTAVTSLDSKRATAVSMDWRSIVFIRCPRSCARSTRRPSRLTLRCDSSVSYHVLPSARAACLSPSPSTLPGARAPPEVISAARVLWCV